MLPYNVTYEYVKAHATALRDLNAGPIHIWEEPYPWHLVTRCEPGGSHRLDISTSVRFYAADPDIDLELMWSFDIEDRNANGKAYYELNVAAISKAMQSIPEPACATFRDYLKDCRTKVEKKGDEWAALAESQYDYARKLGALLK